MKKKNGIEGREGLCQEINKNQHNSVNKDFYDEQKQLLFTWYHLSGVNSSPSKIKLNVRIYVKI